MARDFVPLPAGARGYLLGERSAQQAQQHELGMLANLMELEGRRRAQLQEQQFRGELDALGPNPSQDSLAAIATRYARNPDTILRVHQGSLDRQAAIEANREAIKARLAQQEANAIREHEFRLGQAKNVEDRNAEIARHNRVLEGLREEMFKSRPQPQGTIIQTAEGVFERTPEGLKRLTDPTTGEPLKPKVGEKPVTEYQGKNALYGRRAFMSDKTLTDLEETVNLVGLRTKQGAEATPLIGGALGMAANAALTPEQQRVDQAQRNFVNATLRQESGAVINPDEFENAKKQYFRQPGDSKQVVEQKRANRRAVIEGFKRIAGPAWQDVQETSPDASSGGWSIRPK